MSARQLAAIMFTDMVGYTALMQADEASAKLKQERHRQVFDDAIAAHHGKVMQYYGDGTLSIFSSAIDCVNCAIEIQRILRKPPVVDVRIGIDSGDVILDETGVYGDGVNLASRIESLAVPGSIFISERVDEDLRNQRNVATRDLGFFQVKNVREPIRIYAIENADLVIPTRHEISGKTKTPVQSLAVLPFLNLSRDPENEYFSDGITEELLNALTAVEGLRVISRTSSFAWKGKSEDIRNIAAQLNVEKILEGSVRKAGERVRITAQLINAADGFHIWSETFDRDLTDIFKVQDEISQIIANRLRAKLLQDKKGDALVKSPTENLEAYSIYLKGKFYQNKETPADIAQAMKYFQQAIEMQPDFALPYVYLSGCYALLAGVGAMPAKEAYGKLSELSATALNLDDSLAEAYVSRAVGYMYFDWDWDKAYASLMKALELNPGSSAPLWVLGYYYLMLDSPGQAVEVLEKSWQLDPLAMTLARALSFAYFYNEQFDETIRLSDMQLDVMPENWFAISTKAFSLGMKGDWETALSLHQTSHRLSGEIPMTMSYVAYTLGRLGRTDEAVAVARDLDTFITEHPELGKYQDAGVAWWGIGDYDAAFDRFFKSVGRKEELIMFLINSPILVNIKSDPRYVEARRQMGFPSPKTS